MALMIIVNRENRIIFQKAFSEPKNPMPYILAYAVLDLHQNQYYEAYFAENIVLNCGHRIILVGKKTQKISPKFLGKIKAAFIREIMDPFLSSQGGLSEEFSRQVGELFSQYAYKAAYFL